jgi:hypothetical protein
MESIEVSQNVVLAVIAAPVLSAIVGVLKDSGVAWINRGMMPALISETLGVVFGLLAYNLSPWLYGVAPTSPPAYYIGAGFVTGLTAVGLHAQYKSGTIADENRQKKEGPE